MAKELNPTWADTPLKKPGKKFRSKHKTTRTGYSCREESYTIYRNPKKEPSTPSVAA